jgi:tRNA threonylcarbamoyladenosine biosynthesis protein TsaB
VSNTSAKWLLAIDTSAEQASIALYDGEHFADLSWPAGRDQTVSVLEQIDHLLSLNKLSIADLAAIGVATGPGMFNGLRVGMSVAKGLAYSASLPLIGVSTLDAVALPHVTCGMPVIAVLAAGRGRLLWSNYSGGHTSEPRNGTVDELASEIDAGGIDVLICGELLAVHRETLAQSPHTRLPPRSGVVRRASAVAELAYNRLLNGDFDDLVNLEPTYLHAAGPVRTS